MACFFLLRKKIDTTFIYVTHDQTEAMTLGDRIVIMKAGIIQQVGTPTEVFEMPKNLFVAEFIGAPKMNIFKTNLVEEKGKYSVTPHGSKIEVDGEKGKMLKEKGVKSCEVLLGVRPEHMFIAKEKGPNTITTTLEVNEMMGSEHHLHLVTESGEKVILRVPTLNLTIEERAALVPGKVVYVTFGGNVMHFFNPETTHNLLVDEE